MEIIRQEILNHIRKHRGLTCSELYEDLASDRELTFLDLCVHVRALLESEVVTKSDIAPVNAILTQDQTRVIETKLRGASTNEKDDAWGELWISVIIQAVRDMSVTYKGYQPSLIRKTESQQRQGWRWIEEGRPDFQKVCSLAGLDGDYVQRIIFKVKEFKRAA